MCKANKSKIVARSKVIQTLTPFALHFQQFVFIVKWTFFLFIYAKLIHCVQSTCIVSIGAYFSIESRPSFSTKLLDFIQPHLTFPFFLPHEISIHLSCRSVRGLGKKYHFTSPTTAPPKKRPATQKLYTRKQFRTELDTHTLFDWLTSWLTGAAWYLVLFVF